VSYEAQVRVVFCSACGSRCTRTGWCNSCCASQEFLSDVDAVEDDSEAWRRVKGYLEELGEGEPS